MSKNVSAGQKRSLFLMLMMGGATVYAVCAFGEKYLSFNWRETVVEQSLLGLFPGDLFVVSFSYVPLSKEFLFLAMIF
jgi:hypothetical protein